LQDAEDLTQVIVLKLYPALLSEEIEYMAAFILACREKYAS